MLISTRDIINARDSIVAITGGISGEEYVELREKRPAVEREFIIIDEAVSMLSKFAPERLNLLSQHRKVIRLPTRGWREQCSCQDCWAQAK